VVAVKLTAFHLGHDAMPWPESCRMLAIDPGLTGTGVCLADSGRGGWIVWLGTARPPKSCPRDVPSRVRSICEQIVHALGHNFNVVVVEKPQVYAQRKQEGDPNDLVNVAVLAGAVLGYTRAALTLDPLPHDWKGGVPKKIHHARLKQRFPWATGSNHALDALGLALYGMEKMRWQHR
jgi:hypothetical protein